MAKLLIALLGLLFVCGAPLFTIMLGGTALGALFGTRAASTPTSTARSSSCSAWALASR